MSTYYFPWIIVEVWKLVNSRAIFEKLIITEFKDTFQKPGFCNYNWGLKSILLSYLTSSSLVFMCLSISLPLTADRISLGRWQKYGHWEFGNPTRKKKVLPVIKNQCNLKEALWLSWLGSHGHLCGQNLSQNRDWEAWCTGPVSHHSLLQMEGSFCSLHAS